MSTDDNIFGLKYDAIKLKFNDLNLDELRTICRENEITGFSALNKQALIELIYVEYDTNYNNLRLFNYNELIEKCKKHKLIVDTSSHISKDLLIHIIISLLNIKNKLIKHSIIKELKPSVIESIVKQFVKDIADKKAKKDVKSTPLNDYLSTQFTIPDKTVVKPRQNKQVIGGFLHSTLISNELAIFLDKPIGTLMARTEVTRDINADVKLSTLLKLKCGEELTYFNLQRFLSQHFMSKNVEKEKEAVPVPVPVPVPAVPVPAVPVEPIIDVEPTQRRRPLPTSVRDCVWNHYIGEDMSKVGDTKP